MPKSFHSVLVFYLEISFNIVFVNFESLFYAYWFS